EACVSSGIPWTALLPRPEADFRSDFDKADWERTSTLLLQASRVESLPAARDHDLAYLECGLSTVEESDVMIAVWDGKSSRGTGGTAEVVAHARSLTKPLILIHPDRLDAERERFSLELFSDKEMTYLNHVSGRDRVSDASSAEPEERVREFFQK